MARLSASRVGLDEHEDEAGAQAVGDPHLLAVDLVGAVVDCFLADVLIAWTSEPSSGSDSEKAARISPVAIRGRYFCFCSSVPNFMQQVGADEVRVDDAGDRDPAARELLDDHHVGREVEPHARRTPRGS